MSKNTEFGDYKVFEGSSARAGYTDAFTTTADPSATMVGSALLRKWNAAIITGDQAAIIYATKEIKKALGEHAIYMDTQNLADLAEASSLKSSKRYDKRQKRQNLSKQSPLETIKALGKDGLERLLLRQDQTIRTRQEALDEELEGLYDNLETDLTIAVSSGNLPEFVLLRFKDLRRRAVWIMTDDVSIHDTKKSVAYIRPETYLGNISYDISSEDIGNNPSFYLTFVHEVLHMIARCRVVSYYESEEVSGVTHKKLYSASLSGGLVDKRGNNPNYIKSKKASRLGINLDEAMTHRMALGIVNNNWDWGDLGDAESSQNGFQTYMRQRRLLCALSRYIPIQVLVEGYFGVSDGLEDKRSENKRIKGNIHDAFRSSLGCTYDDFRRSVEDKDRLKYITIALELGRLDLLPIYTCYRTNAIAGMAKDKPSEETQQRVSLGRKPNFRERLGLKKREFPKRVEEICERVENNKPEDDYTVRLGQDGVMAINIEQDQKCIILPAQIVEFKDLGKTFKYRINVFVKKSPDGWDVKIDVRVSDVGSEFRSTIEDNNPRMIGATDYMQIYQHIADHPDVFAEGEQVSIKKYPFLLDKILSVLERNTSIVSMLN
ncbi:MAG: hypothetical protein QG647_686 [Patescibacteria group bacterium]|nr:hypothetical protein [Patescibacteria group bacterium]